MGYLSRQPTSNDPSPEVDDKYKFLRKAVNGEIDSFFLLLSEKAKRCKECARPVMVDLLKENLCPDCFLKGEATK